MTTWASHHFESCCSETVFPVPKPPGIAAVPPFAIGNRKSMTQLDRKRLAGVCHGLSGPDPGGLLVHLDDRLLSENLDDLAHELLRPDEHDVIHARLHADGGHDRSGDALDRAGSLDVRRHLRARRHVAHLT